MTRKVDLMPKPAVTVSEMRMIAKSLGAIDRELIEAAADELDRLRVAERTEREACAAVAETVIRGRTPDVKPITHFVARKRDNGGYNVHVEAGDGEYVGDFTIDENDALRKLIKEFADAVERLAFTIPPPNEFTPQFVQMAQAARRTARHLTTKAQVITGEHLTGILAHN